MALPLLFLIFFFCIDIFMLLLQASSVLCTRILGKPYMAVFFLVILPITLSLQQHAPPTRLSTYGVFLCVFFFCGSGD